MYNLKLVADRLVVHLLQIQDLILKSCQYTKNCFSEIGMQIRKVQNIEKKYCNESYELFEFKNFSIIHSILHSVTFTLVVCQQQLTVKYTSIVLFHTGKIESI